MQKLTRRIAWILVAGALGSLGLGAVAQAGDPVDYEATWKMGFRQLTSEKAERDEGVSVIEGGSWQERIVETSDPRLDGTLTVALNHTVYGTLGPEVFVARFRIENEVGAWQEVPRLALAHSRGLPTADFTTMLIGEGGYAGFFAIVDVETDFARSEWTVHGYVIEGDPPRTPDPVRAVE